MLWISHACHSYERCIIIITFAGSDVFLRLDRVKRGLFNGANHKIGQRHPYRIFFILRFFWRFFGPGQAIFRKKNFLTKTPQKGHFCVFLGKKIFEKKLFFERIIFSNFLDFLRFFEEKKSFFG